MRSLGPLGLVLLLAAVPRVAWYRSHPPELHPDSYAYLNTAREWRGERPPDRVWDDRAQAPWNNLAVRTPGYPLFLNAVFALVGHSPTPAPALAEPRRLLEGGSAARAHHLEHLTTDENVRAVQATQHVLGIVSTGVAFATVLVWTQSPAASLVGALIAIGWNPVWITMLEPSIVTEPLALLLLLLAVWIAAARESTRAGATARDHAAAAACALGVIVRPAFLFAAVPVLWLLAVQRRTAAVLVLPAALLALVVVNNGVRYQYWALSSNGSLALIRHAEAHPEGLREPLRDPAMRLRGATFAQELLRGRYIERGESFADAERDLDRAALAFVADHPLWTVRSVAESLVDFFAPPLRLVPGDSNIMRQRARPLWLALSVAVTLLTWIGLASLFAHVPPTVRLTSAMFLVSAAGTSLTAGLAENARFAAPLVPFLVMAGVVVLERRLSSRLVDDRRASV